MHVDAIVNTEPPRTMIGSGTDAAIHVKAGPQLLEARKRIRVMNTAEACITPGFDLPAKYAIHTVGPVWHDGSHGEDYLPQKSQSISITELKERLEKTESDFSDSLLYLIDRTGKKDSELYKKFNIDRKLVSKIRNNPNYKSSKATAVAFDIALELDLDQTKELIGKAGYARPTVVSSILSLSISSPMVL